MYKKLFLASVLIWIVSLGIFAKFFITGSTTPSADSRKTIHLSPSEKDVVLGEMRTVLKSLNGVLKSLGESNFKQASSEAKKAGAGMAVDINPVVMAKLPLEFKKIGMGMHDDFDKFSLDLERGMTEKQALVRMGEITNKCITCHVTYRLE
ncbi:MAG: hypothetical protein HOP07_07700 [Bacteriovoracaceae bacterium]|nr:hypothetical protein [Bacteriovoracaceae bacterium]